MSNMKCPFCQQELQDVGCGLTCLNCKKDGLNGDPDLWQELIRTRKALDVAIDWLEQVATPAKCDDELCREFTKRKLTEIKTALEQKDK